MADHTTTIYANFLRELKGPLQENFPKYHVLLDNLRRDSGWAKYGGKQVTVPLILNPLQGGGPLAETGTVNTPQTLRSTQAVIGMSRLFLPVSLTPDVMMTSQYDDGSWKDATANVVEEATIALARLENEYTCGAGNGLLGTASATTNTTAVTVQPSTATSGDNFYPLYVGRVVDVATISTGALVTGGTARRITAVVPSTGVLTLGDGGGNCNVTTTTDGVFVQGAPAMIAAAATQPAGIQQVASTTVSFQGITKSSEPGWQGTDGRAGVTTAVDLSIAILDGCEREAGKSGMRPKWYMGDERVVDKYTQGLTIQARWGGDEGTLSAGWKGVKYREKVVMTDYDFKRNSVYGIQPESLSFYGYEKGPDWDEKDGSMFKRFSRTPTLEAWLTDYYNFAAYRCNTLVFANNLNAA